MGIGEYLGRQVTKDERNAARQGQPDTSERLNRDALIAELTNAGATFRGNTCRCLFHDDCTPSAGVYRDDKGVWRYKCHGCGVSGDIFDIRARLHGKELKEVLPKSCGNGQSENKSGPLHREPTLDDMARYQARRLNGRTEAIHVYLTDKQVPALGVIRLRLSDGDKTFRQARPDGAVWVDEKPKGLLPIYSLPAVLEEEEVVFVEGEMTANALIDLGIVATTTAMGAGKAQYTDLSPLAGRRVYLWNDNDGAKQKNAGQRHMDDVASRLAALDPRPELYRLDVGPLALPEKGDAVDFIAQLTGTLNEKREVIWRAIREHSHLVDLDACEKPVEDKSESEAAEKPAKPKWNFQRLPALLSEPVVPVQWLVHGILPAAGVSLVVSKPKVGKSTLARCLALAVAHGRPFLERPTVSGSVYYVALEEIKEEVVRHFRTQGADGTEDILIHPQVAPQNGLAELHGIIKQERPALLIVDPLFRLVRMRDGNDYAEVTAAMEPLIDLARRSGTHVMLLHHARKGDGADGDNILGSTALFGAVDTVITLRKTDTYRTVSTVQRYGQCLEEHALNFSFESGCVSLGGSRADVELSKVKDQILSFLTGQHEAIPEKVINDAVQSRTRQKCDALRDLLRHGHIVREGSGRRNDPYRYRVSTSLLPGIQKKLGSRNENPVPQTCVEASLDNNLGPSEPFLLSTSHDLQDPRPWEAQNEPPEAENEEVEVRV